MDPEECKEDQLNEIEALESIFDSDFKGENIVFISILTVPRLFASLWSTRVAGPTCHCLLL